MTFGFLVAVEADREIDKEFVANRLIEGVLWIDGIGKADVECLGKLDVYPDEVDEEKES